MRRPASKAKPSARALADVSRGTVVATVDIEAPAERVFHALTDPRELMHWWGSPQTYQAHSVESDFRVGGCWRVEGKQADGVTYAVTGEFLEIDPPRRLVQTWSHDWDGDHPVTKVTYVLEAIPGATRVTVRHEGFGARADACNAHAQGWEQVLDWLADHLEASGASATPLA